MIDSAINTPHKNEAISLDLLNIQPSAESMAYLNGKHKRCMDILGAMIGLVVGAPIFLLAALIVKVVDKVPVLYFQERFGLHGKPFTIIKLRTLSIYEKHLTGKPRSIHKKPDYETTRTGKFWRVTSIDEMVQFILVLKGDMSLIGHRPFPFYYLPHLKEMEHMTQDQFEHYLNAISQYKPGMSSLSSVNGRGNLTMHEKFEYDLIYAREASFTGDIKLLFQTLYVVLTREGAK
jgi:lipopolysaccharide/colanic/teichoic acid biosynthesis glycosyltransferase